MTLAYVLILWLIAAILAAIYLMRLPDTKSVPDEDYPTGPAGPPNSLDEWWP